MRITRVGQNEVEVIKTRLMSSASGARGMKSEVEVLDESTKVFYGRQKIEAERRVIQAELECWSDPRKVEEKINDLRAKLSELDEIEQELNR